MLWNVFFSWALHFSANKYENANNKWHFHSFSGEMFLLSWVEHENNLITSGPGHSITLPSTLHNIGSKVVPNVIYLTLFICLATCFTKCLKRFYLKQNTINFFSEKKKIMQKQDCVKRCTDTETSSCQSKTEYVLGKSTEAEDIDATAQITADVCTNTKSKDTALRKTICKMKKEMKKNNQCTGQPKKYKKIWQMFMRT